MRSAIEPIEPFEAGDVAPAPATEMNRAVRPSARGTRVVVGQAALLWLVTRVALAAFTALAVLLPQGGGASQLHRSLRDLAAAWARWDAQWYLRIAQHGYANDQSAAFFPLYPLLIRATAALTGGHWLFAALLVANLGTLAGFIGVALLAACESGRPRSGAYAVLALATYPLAFFLAAPYTEGPFIGFAAFALFGARSRRWRLAALCAALAMLTRPTGVILVAPLAYEYGRTHGWWARDTLRDGALWSGPGRGRIGEALAVIAAAPAALALYMVYLWRAFGDPLLFLHAQRYWRHADNPALAAMAAAAHGAPGGHTAHAVFVTLTYDLVRSLVDLAPLALFVALAIVAARRQPVLYTLYMAGLLLLILVTPRPDRLGIFVSAGRYLCAAIPIFLLLGNWAERRPWRELVLACGLLAQAALAEVYLAGGWLV